MLKFLKSRPAESSRFSEFIREASSEEKKKVYTKVMKRASEAQNAILSRRTSSTAK
jgi:hypothetical protein